LRDPTKTNGKAKAKGNAATSSTIDVEDVAWRMSKPAPKEKNGNKKRKQPSTQIAPKMQSYCVNKGHSISVRAEAAVTVDVDAEKSEALLQPDRGEMLLANGIELQMEAMEFVSAASKRLKLLHSTSKLQLVAYPHHSSLRNSSSFSSDLNTQRQKLVSRLSE
jgi:hypothetical protein